MVKAMKQKGIVFLGALAVIWVVAGIVIIGGSAVVSHNKDTVETVGG